MDVLGSNFSKAKARKIQSVHNLFKDPSYDKECKQFLKNNNMTEDHIYLISDLKKDGNMSAHNRPDILRSEFEKNALLTFDDEDDKKMTLDLIEYLATASKIDPNSVLFTIKKPY